MPPKNNDKQQRQQLKQLLSEWGIGGQFMALIDAAVRQDWSSGEFTQRLVHTDAFHQRYPGLVERNGTLANGITGAEGEQTTLSNLAGAIRRYEQFQDAYSKVGQLYGYGPVNRHQMALLIKKSVSPSEFQNRLSAIHNVAKNQDQLQALAQQAGLGKNVSNGELWRMAAGEGSGKLYNQLEAAQLQTQVGLSRGEAKAAAKDVGEPGAYNQQNLDQLISYVRQNLTTIGPELAQQGMNTARLVKVLANPGDFASEVDKIQQVVATRKGLNQGVVGTYGRQGPGGGFAQYTPDAAASYG